MSMPRRGGWLKSGGWHYRPRSGCHPWWRRGGVRQWAGPPVRERLAMGVVWYRLRVDVRVRWRTLALIAVLVGVGGGVALTAFAGARRTSAAVPQMLAYSRPDDGQTAVGGFFCPPRRVTGPAARSLAPLPAAARVLRLPRWRPTCACPTCFSPPAAPAWAPGAST